MTTGNSSRRTLGLGAFFDDDLEDTLPQQAVREHLLELHQPSDVRGGHHPELLLSAVERLRRDVQLLADLGLASPGLVLADRLDLVLLRVPFLAHVCRVYGGGVMVGQPLAIISTDPI